MTNLQNILPSTKFFYAIYLLINNHTINDNFVDLVRRQKFHNSVLTKLSIPGFLCYFLFIYNFFYIWFFLYLIFFYIWFFYVWNVFLFVHVFWDFLAKLNIKSYVTILLCINVNVFKCSAMNLWEWYYKIVEQIKFRWNYIMSTSPLSFNPYSNII